MAGDEPAHGAPHRRRRLWLARRRACASRPARAEATLTLDGGTLVVEQARVSAGGASSSSSRGRAAAHPADHRQRVGPRGLRRRARRGARARQRSRGAASKPTPRVDVTERPCHRHARGRVAGADASRASGPGAPTVGGRFEGAQLVLDVARRARLRRAARGRGTARPSRLGAHRRARAGSRASTPRRSRGRRRARTPAVGAGERHRCAGRRRAGTSRRRAAKGRSRSQAGAGAGPRSRREPPRCGRAAARSRSPGARVEARGARVDGRRRARRLGRGRAAAGAAELPLPSLPALLADLGQPSRAPEIAGTAAGRGRRSRDRRPPCASRRACAGRSSPSAAARSGSMPSCATTQGRLSVAPLVLRSGSGQATLAGGIPLAPDGEWDLTGEIDALELEPALALFGLEGERPGHRERSRDGTLATSRWGARRCARPRACDGRRPRPRRRDRGRTWCRRARGREHGPPRPGGAARRPSSPAGASPGPGTTIRRRARSRRPWRRAASRGRGCRSFPRRRDASTGTLAGRAGALRQHAAAPAGELLLTLADAAFDGSAAAAAVGRGALRRARAETHRHRAATPFLQGSAPLEGDWPLRLEIDAKALPLQPLLDALGRAPEARATLEASGTIAVELPLREPSRLRYASSDLAVSGRIRAPRVAHGARSRSAGTARPSSSRGCGSRPGKAWLSARRAASRSRRRARSTSSSRATWTSRLSTPRSPGGRWAGTASCSCRCGARASPRRSRGASRSRTSGDASRAPAGATSTSTARFAGRELRVERLEANLLGGQLSASGGVPLVRRRAGRAPRLALRAARRRPRAASRPRAARGGRLALAAASRSTASCGPRRCRSPASPEAAG